MACFSIVRTSACTSSNYASRVITPSRRQSNSLLKTGLWPRDSSGNPAAFPNSPKTPIFTSFERKIIISLSANPLNINLHFSRKSGLYRYSFNGKESDGEASDLGEGTQDYGFRIYNPSLGKFLSVDPIGTVLPYWSPYHFAGNTPIQASDLDGLEPIRRTFQLDGITYNFKSKIQTPQSYKIRKSGSLFWNRVTFKSTYDDDNDGEKDASMNLLAGSHSRAVQGKKLNDVSKMGEFNSTDLKFLLALLKDNPDIGFVIIGGHDVPTIEEWRSRIEKLQSQGNMKTALDETNNPPHLFGQTPSDIRVDAFDRNNSNEEGWTLERADFIKNRYFNNSPYVTTYSARKFGVNAFPGMKLNPWNNDPVGITIFFDYRVIPENKKAKKTPPPAPRNKHGNPRFL